MTITPAMKSDLPCLMRAHNLDALVIFGSDGFGPANAPFIYFVGDAHVTIGLATVKANGEAYLVHYTIERDEADKTGLKLVNKAAYNRPTLIQQHGSDRLADADAPDLRQPRDSGPRGLLTSTSHSARLGCARCWLSRKTT